MFQGPYTTPLKLANIKIKKLNNEQSLQLYVNVKNKKKIVHQFFGERRHNFLGGNFPGANFSGGGEHSRLFFQFSQGCTYGHPQQILNLQCL